MNSNGLPNVYTAMYPIFIALRMQNRELVGLLMKHGLDLKVKNQEGVTPVEWLDSQEKQGLSLEKIGQMKMWLKLFKKNTT